jgi:hypothetical protein
MSNILYLEPEKGEEIGSRIYIIFLSERERERERERVEKRHVRKGAGGWRWMWLGAFIIGSIAFKVNRIRQKLPKSKRSCFRN